MNLVLVGYRGSGKTTVGLLLAERLGYRFLDLDAKITESTGRSIRDIFEAEGEEGFRVHELDALKSIRRLDRHVIALGGGAMDHPDNRVMARRLGRIVWLRAPAIVLWSRISGDESSSLNRPDLTPTGGLKEVESILARREPIYRHAAKHVVDTVSMKPSEVVDAIELWVRADDAEHE